ncbi:MAG TPA: RNA-binding protein [Gemmataceae bacterium]|nr:RNA-binding protein [Gemmataceae bacterium]
MTRLHIGNLPYDYSDRDLRILVEDAGAGRVADAEMIRDGYRPEKSRGYGFVEMASDAEAQKAIELLDGAEVGRRIISVSPARAKGWPREASRTQEDHNEH